MSLFRFSATVAQIDVPEGRVRTDKKVARDACLVTHTHTYDVEIGLANRLWDFTLAVSATDELES